MAVRKLNIENLRTMSLFSDICGSQPLDCFEVNGATIFITGPGQTGKAIGKDGANVKRLRQALKRDVKVIETANSVDKLVKNYVFPIKPEKINIENDTVAITFPTSRERRAVLNNNQRELKKLKAVVQRYHPEVRDIRIL